MRQDGAEHGSHLASSEKTLHFFVCFIIIIFFVVMTDTCFSTINLLPLDTIQCTSMTFASPAYV